MDPNLTLIGQTVAMIVFVWFCMKFIWPPIMGAIEERQTQIADGLAAAERGQKNFDKSNAAAEETIGQARKQAATILDQANARANEIVAEGRADGMKEREHQLVTARAEIVQETNRAKEELRSEVSGIAIAGAEKILQREIDSKAHADILSKLAAKL